jgi:hypothetical protein
MNNTHMLAGSILLVFIALCQYGCVPKEVRDDTRLLAAYTNRVRENGEQFATRRGELSKARLRNIDAMNINALQAEQFITSKTNFWKITGDDSRLNLYKQVFEAVQLAADQQKTLSDAQQDNVKSVATLQTAVTIKSDKLNETAKALSQLAEQPSFKDSAAFYITFFKELTNKLKEGETQTKNQIDQGKTEIELKTIKADAQ